MANRMRTAARTVLLTFEHAVNKPIQHRRTQVSTTGIASCAMLVLGVGAAIAYTLLLLFTEQIPVVASVDITGQTPIFEFQTAGNLTVNATLSVDADSPCADALGNVTRRIRPGHPVLLPLCATSVLYNTEINTEPAGTRLCLRGKLVTLREQKFIVYIVIGGRRVPIAKGEINKNTPVRVSTTEVFDRANELRSTTVQVDYDQSVETTAPSCIGAGGLMWCNCVTLTLKSAKTQSRYQPRYQPNFVVTTVIVAFNVINTVLARCRTEELHNEDGVFVDRHAAAAAAAEREHLESLREISLDDLP